MEEETQECARATGPAHLAIGSPPMVTPLSVGVHIGLPQITARRGPLPGEEVCEILAGDTLAAGGVHLRTEAMLADLVSAMPLTRVGSRHRRPWSRP
jgi:hypothetical protein